MPRPSPIWHWPDIRMVTRSFTLPSVYPILDTASLDRLDLDPILTAEAFLEGGAQILQFRHKTFWSRDTFALAGQIAKLCSQAQVPFIVNDRADYAAILGAGLHVGQEDLLPSDARRVIGPGAILGYSTHNPAQMAAAQNEPIDYVAFGPVFPTQTKENPDPTTGIDTLRTVGALNTLPLVAIGGITVANSLMVWQAGADSVAVISDLLQVSFPLSASVTKHATKQYLRDRLIEWQKLNQR